jgi:hypothetical protein
VAKPTILEVVNISEIVKPVAINTLETAKRNDMTIKPTILDIHKVIAMPVLAAILPIKSTLASPSIITPPKEISIKSTLQTLVPTIKPSFGSSNSSSYPTCSIYPNNCNYPPISTYEQYISYVCRCG